MVDQNNWTTSRCDPKHDLVRPEETDRNFRNLCIGIMANIHGFRVSMHCSMASEVMESFPLSFLLLSIKHAFELPEVGTVAASKVNGSVVTA